MVQLLVLKHRRFSFINQILRIFKKYICSKILELVFTRSCSLHYELWKEKMKVEVASRTRSTRDSCTRYYTGTPSTWCGSSRERGPHTCKRMLLKGRAEPKNRSLKCNDIVVFNVRLFKTVPFVFLEPASYFCYQPPSTRLLARSKPL